MKVVVASDFISLKVYLADCPWNQACSSALCFLAPFRPAEPSECLRKGLQDSRQPQRSEPAHGGPHRQPDAPLTRQWPPARQTLEVKTLSVLVEYMFCLLSEPLRSSPVGHFQKLLQRKDRDICDRPCSLFLSPAPLPHPTREGVPKTRGMTGSSVLPTVYKIFKSLKLSRKKRV